MKKLLSIILSIIMVMTVSIYVFATDIDLDNSIVNLNDDSAESVIFESAKAINMHDINGYISLQCGENKNDYENFFKGLEWDHSNEGIMCVDSALIYEIKEIPLNEAEAFTSIYKYKEKYDELSAFYVGFDYKVNNESKYFFNGVNYRLVIVGKENGIWKIIEESDAPVESLSKTEYAFESNAENKALNIIDARMNGVILNGKLKAIDFEEGDIISTQRASDAEHVKPSYIRVYRTSSNKVENIDLYSYIKNVLPNEWYASWPSESLKTGAMACKMYGWYHHYHPKRNSLNADVKDTTADQVYKPNTETAATTAAINAVNGIGIQNSAGKIFETQYVAGTSGTAGSGNTGKISQYGSKYLAENGWTYMSICAYYYNVSDKSNQRISQFTY